MDSGDASGHSAGVDDDYESLLSTTDAELLKQAWQNEKAAPEILQFEAALVQRSREQIQLMVCTFHMIWPLKFVPGIVICLYFEL